MKRSTSQHQIHRNSSKKSMMNTNLSNTQQNIALTSLMTGIRLF